MDKIYAFFKKIYYFFYRCFSYVLGYFNIYYSKFYKDTKYSELESSIFDKDTTNEKILRLFKQKVIQSYPKMMMDFLYYLIENNNKIVIEISKQALQNSKFIDFLENEETERKGSKLLIKIIEHYANFASKLELEHYENLISTLLKCDVIKNNTHLNNIDIHGRYNPFWYMCRYNLTSIAIQTLQSNNKIYEYNDDFNNPYNLNHNSYYNYNIINALCATLMHDDLTLFEEIIKYEHVKNNIHGIKGVVIFTACKYNRTTVVKSLLENENVRNNINFSIYNPLLESIYNKNEDIASLLLECKEVQKNLSFDQYIALRVACTYGLPNIVNKMLEFKDVWDNAAINDNDAFYNAIRKGHENIAIILWQNENVKNNVSSNNYLAFRYACANGLIEIVKLMLEDESVRTNAATLNNQAYEQAAINGHGGITGLLIEHCPAVVRYLRENRTENTQNSILYANNHKESAMASLTMEKELELREIIGEYLNLSQEKVEESFKDLINFLNNKYLQDPAIIHIGTEKLVLPLTWKEFVDLKNTKNFDGFTYTKALKAYWNHQPHSKLRYFLEPNMWMDSKALYVNWVQRNNQWTATADFKLEKTLIAQLWLVACGKDEDTKLNFTAAFYDINRAYNQIDKEYNPSGSPDAGDNPTCLYGVKSRLYMAACLLCNKEKINDDIINTYVYEFVKDHYEKLYNNLDINEKVHLINLIEENIGTDSSEVESKQIMEQTEKINDNTEMLNYFNTVSLKCNPKSQMSLFELAEKKNIIFSNKTVTNAKTRTYDKTLQDYNISDDTVNDCINSIQNRFTNNQFKEQHRNYILEKFVLNAGEYHLIKFFSSCNLKNIFYLEDNEINNSYSSCSLSMSN